MAWYPSRKEKLRVFKIFLRLRLLPVAPIWWKWSSCGAQSLVFSKQSNVESGDQDILLKLLVMLKFRVMYWVQTKRGGVQDVQIRYIRRILTLSMRELMRRNLARNFLENQSFESSHRWGLSYEVKSLIGQKRRQKSIRCFHADIKRCEALSPF